MNRHQQDASEEGLLNYYRLKSRLEEQKRSKNGTKKCVHCGKPSMTGTLFTTVYHNETDRSEGYRELKASCGTLSDPCDLKLSIRVPKTESLSDILESIEKDLEVIKKKIMNDKNQLLFGYITDEVALKRFNENKEALESFTLLSQKYLDLYTNILHNPERKEHIDDATLRLYESVQKIKQELSSGSGSAGSIEHAVTLYQQECLPLMQTLRDLTYEVNLVLYTESGNPVLYQRPVSLHHLEYTFL